MGEEGGGGAARCCCCGFISLFFAVESASLAAAAAAKSSAEALLLKLLPQHYFDVSKRFGSVWAPHLPHISSKAARRQWSMAAPAQDTNRSRVCCDAAAADADKGASEIDMV